jgi:hypothetical protein
VTDGFTQYCVDDFPVRVIGLDSIIEGGELPEFDDERARWLDHVLSADPAKPALLAIHHPPFRTGVAFADLAARDWADPLARIIARHSQVKLVVAGHAHTTLNGEIAGVRAYAAPSTAFQLVSAMGVDEASLRDDVTGPVSVHFWDGEGFITGAYDMRDIAESERLDRLSNMSWKDMKAEMKVVRRD